IQIDIKKVRQLLIYTTLIRNQRTGLKRIEYDQRQSQFRQVRLLAEQKEKINLNPFPFKFTYKAEKKEKYKEAGVIDYRRIDFKRSEEHTSELQSRFDLVCSLL